MMPLLFLAAASADLDALEPGGRAVRSRDCKSGFLGRSGASAAVPARHLSRAGGDRRGAPRHCAASARPTRKRAQIKAGDEQKFTLEKLGDRRPPACAQRSPDARRHPPGRDGFDAALFPHELPRREDRQVRCLKIHEPSRDRRRQADPERHFAVRAGGRSARDHGSERIGQVDTRLRARRPSGLRSRPTAA